MTTTETQIVWSTAKVYDTIRQLINDVNNLADNVESYCIDNFVKVPLADRDMDTMATITLLGKVKEMLHYALLMKNKLGSDIEAPESPFSAHKSLDKISNSMVALHELMRAISTNFNKMDLETMETKLREFRGGKTDAAH